MSPIVELAPCSISAANELLVSWGHVMGPCNRPWQATSFAHVLQVHNRPVAVTITAGLIAPHPGGLGHITRDNAVELARLCAGERWACRVMLRLWREVVFPATGKRFAVSYQDADIHTGNTYRFDGWRRMAYSRAGGTDRRSGRAARNKWVWLWETADQERAAA